MNKDGVKTHTNTKWSENTYNLTIPSATIILMLHTIIYYINIKLLHGLYIIMKKQPDLLLCIIIMIII